MRFVLRLVTAILLTITAAHAQLALIGAGGAAAGGASYVGPGDVVSGATEWWGIRGYNHAAAVAGVNAVILCTPLDAACETETISLTGALALGTVGSTCNNSTVICTGKQLYSQSGSGHNLTQATIANRPTFVTGCLTSGAPCLAFNASNSQSLTGSITSTSNTPSVSYCFDWTGNFSTENDPTTTNATSEYLKSGPPIILGMFASNGSGAQNVTVTQNAWHTEQSVYGTAGILILDGTATSVNTGTASGGTNVTFGTSTANGHYLTGKMTEVGYWNTAFTSTQGGNMNTNQHPWCS